MATNDLAVTALKTGLHLLSQNKHLILNGVEKLISLSSKQESPTLEKRQLPQNMSLDQLIHGVPYSPTGDTLLDFAGVGTRGNPVPKKVIPFPPSNNGDDLPRLQPLIDSAQEGVVIQFERGEYRFSSTIRVEKSNIHFVGAGPGTVLIATGRGQDPLVFVGGKGWRTRAGGRNGVVDEYVPVGARELRVKKQDKLKVGDLVRVVRVGTDAWIREMGMDRLPPRKDGKPVENWKGFEVEFDRVVTGVKEVGSGVVSVTVDEPIPCSIEARWGGGYIYTYQSGRIENVVVRDMTFRCTYNPEVTALDSKTRTTYLADKHHALRGLEIANAQNILISGILSSGFDGFVELKQGTKWATIQGCTHTNPVSPIDGAWRYTFFNNGAQLVLVKECMAQHARHAFVFGARVCGPNVFTHCVSKDELSTSQPHHRWSVGGLYDCIKGGVDIENRSNMGTGHGWSGGNFVIWNVDGDVTCQSPPTATNFAVGVVGKKKVGYVKGMKEGWWISPGRHVRPESLYLFQVERRGKNPSLHR